jgi:hypothetical protein
MVRRIRRIKETEINVVMMRQGERDRRERLIEREKKSKLKILKN